MNKTYLTSSSSASTEFPKELLIWNYWDHEHVVGTHFEHYKRVKILFEKDNFCLSERWAKLPFIPFYHREICFQFLSNENQMDVFHYGILNIIKFRQKFIFQKDEKNNCTVTRNDYLEIPKILKFLQPLFEKIMKTWFTKVWNEDMPMRERRLKVWKLGFQDFKGIDYVNDPNIKQANHSERPYEVKLPIPKITQISNTGAKRLFKKSKHIGYGLPNL